MGMLRVLLAICVILAHTHPVGFQIADGGTAVQCFYVISGYFMALILNEKYVSKSSNRIFYSNRFLRYICDYLPILFIIICISMVNYHISHTGCIARWVENWQRLTVLDIIAFGLSNLIFLGHDWSMYLEFGQHGLHIASNLHQLSKVPVSLFFVAQAWTLGVEVTFFLVAPFLVRRHWSILVCFVVLPTFARYVAVTHGLDKQFWFNGFFPFELGLFMLGALSYKVSAKFKRRMRGAGWTIFGMGILVAVILFPLYESDANEFFNMGHIFLYLYLAVGLPALFEATSRVRWDRSIGDLSYPVYLCHEIFGTPLNSLNWGKEHPRLIAMVIIVASCALASLVVHYIDVPVNRFRQLRLQRAECEVRQKPREGVLVHNSRDAQ